jgi:hypothetical protein
MDLGPSAFVTAGHVAMITSLGLLFWRMITMLDGHAPSLALRRGWVAGLGLAAWVLVIERVYYVAARLLVPSDYDLWSMHPAPAILSALVVVGLQFVSVPLILALYPRPRAHRRIAAEIGAIAALWGLCAWVLY